MAAIELGRRGVGFAASPLMGATPAQQMTGLADSFGGLTGAMGGMGIGGILGLKSPIPGGLATGLGVGALVGGLVGSTVLGPLGKLASRPLAHLPAALQYQQGMMQLAPSIQPGAQDAIMNALQLGGQTVLPFEKRSYRAAPPGFGNLPDEMAKLAAAAKQRGLSMADALPGIAQFRQAAGGWVFGGSAAGDPPGGRTVDSSSELERIALLHGSTFGMQTLGGLVSGLRGGARWSGGRQNWSSAQALPLQTKGMIRALRSEGARGGLAGSDITSTAGMWADEMTARRRTGQLLGFSNAGQRSWLTNTAGFQDTGGRFGMALGPRRSQQVGADFRTAAATTAISGPQDLMDIMMLEHFGDLDLSGGGVSNAMLSQAERMMESAGGITPDKARSLVTAMKNMGMGDRMIRMMFNRKGIRVGAKEAHQIATGTVDDATATLWTSLRESALAGGGDLGAGISAPFGARRAAGIRNQNLRTGLKVQATAQDMEQRIANIDSNLIRFSALFAGFVEDMLGHINKQSDITGITSESEFHPSDPYQVMPKNQTHAKP